MMNPLFVHLSDLRKIAFIDIFILYEFLASSLPLFTLPFLCCASPA